MGNSLFLNFILFVFIGFLFKSKRLHIFEYWFVFMINVFIYTSFISVIVDNMELWSINEKPLHFALFRLTEVILFPILTLWFIEWMSYFKHLIQKFFFIILFLLFPVLIEKWLILIKIITYKEWTIYKTGIFWGSYLLITLLTWALIRHLLMKEGVMKHASTSKRI